MRIQTWMESGGNWQSWNFTWSAINRTASIVASPPCFPSLINKDLIAPLQSFLPIQIYHLRINVGPYSRQKEKKKNPRTCRKHVHIFKTRNRTDVETKKCTIMLRISPWTVQCYLLWFFQELPFVFITTNCGSVYLVFSVATWVWPWLFVATFFQISTQWKMVFNLKQPQE